MSVRRVIGEARDAAATGVLRARSGVGLRLRAAIVGGMVLAMLASIGAGGPPAWLVAAIILGATIAAAVRPDTHIGLGVLFAFCWYWLAHVDARNSPWTVLAAAGLLVFHVATSAAALGPAEVELPRSLLVAWTRRCLPILGGTAALWLVTALLTRADAGSNVVLSCTALVVVAAGGWLALARSKPDVPGSESRP